MRMSPFSTSAQEPGGISFTFLLLAWPGGICNSAAKLFRLHRFALRPRGPRRRNAAEPGVISLRSITPAKAAFAATDIVFSFSTYEQNKKPPHENCVWKIETPPPWG